MIISLHTPKAAGSSFQRLLRKHYFIWLVNDYADLPINKTIDERHAEVLAFRESFGSMKKAFYKFRGVQCIHGHFLPYKYLDVFKGDVQYITWLRDPLERLASHYHFWMRDYDPRFSAKFHTKVFLENWSFEKFCFSEEMQNVYDQFLWNFPVERFDFIGITEHFNEDVDYFRSHFLNNTKHQAVMINTNAAKKEPYFTDKGLLKELREFHAKDYAIYEYALAQREKRIGLTV